MTNGIPKLWNSNILVIFGGTRRDTTYCVWDNLFFPHFFFPIFFCFEVSLKERERFRNTSYIAGQVVEEGDTRWHYHTSTKFAKEYPATTRIYDWSTMIWREPHQHTFFLSPRVTLHNQRQTQTTERLYLSHRVDDLLEPTSTLVRRPGTTGSRG